MFITGWLSPEGKMYNCEYMDHIAKADTLIKEYNYEKENNRPDDILMNHGWVHLTKMSFCMPFPQWCIFWKDPSRRHLTEAQKIFLKPYIEEYKDFICESCITDLKYEFDFLQEEY